MTTMRLKLNRDVKIIINESKEKERSYVKNNVNNVLTFQVYW